MADDGNILFVRGNNHDEAASDNEDVWDDSLLIKAYDRAVNLAKEEVAKRLSMETDSSRMKSVKSQNPKQSGQRNDQKKKWTVGAPCRAVYSVDGEIYEAVITKIFSDSRTCLVTFIGYNNTEKVQISSLQNSDGLESQTAQIKEADSVKACYNNVEDTQESKNHNDSSGERMEYESELPRQQNHIPHSETRFNSPIFGMMPPAPPLPPQLMARLPDNDADALSSMLMSWYISGFHTGYYHGFKQAENNDNRRKK